MTLDEIINHARDKVQENRKKEKNYREYSKEDGDIWGENITDCIKCAEEHEQLADWLEELKMYKSLSPRELVSAKQKNDRVIEYSKGFDFGYKTAYSKAIDDLTEKISKYRTYDDWGNVINVLKIAEKLKEHKTLNIVHCKDCIHWGTGVVGETENVKCCEFGKYMVGANGYCVYGEKECEE